MKAKVFTQDGKVKGEMALADSVFNADVNEQVMYLVVKTYLANQRQGTAKTKGRSEVSGGGRKPWKQKHTGNARAGSNTSPIWVRGGKAFGPVPRDYYRHIPKTMRRIALTSALSSRAKEEKVSVVAGITCDAPKTKTIAAMIGALSLADKRTLLVIDQASKNIYLSGRNIKNLTLKPVSEINAYDVLSNDAIVFGSEAIVKKIEEAYAQ
ncbi:MAG TPA: 50S ribosomal protein L4 [Chitinivibrionales bacterium]|nr:50S ribosomal protein L4 [Chitinivibrionales bacterium]